MTSPRILSVLATGLLLTGLLAGCTPAPEPKPTKTAAFASDEEAFAAAKKTYEEYTEALNAVDTADPETFEPVFALSSGDFEAADRKTLSTLHAEELNMTGQTRIFDFVGQESTPPFSTVVATVCVDVSDTDVTDSSGTSIVSPDREAIYGIEVKFKESHGQMRIDHAKTVEDAKCTPQ